ncbi:hypothetical protein BHM03_00035092 [Ensete ventricosum]|nr:hypothetical protein BHM03_00035092 [Ensete ventricosum]
MFQVPNTNLSQTTLQTIDNGSSKVTVASDQPLSYEAQIFYGLKKSLENEGDLKKLDSFGRWMSKEIGKDCDDSLMASDSCNYWNAMDAQNDDKEVSSLSCHMQLDMDSLGPSLSQEQLFTIHDFSPDWAFSGIETKVLIAGTFLGSVEPRSIKWSCMFGELEVSAEVLTSNVIRCKAPLHTPGRVPFYITCSNRIACSEIREFEYRENLSSFSSVPERDLEEVSLQVRFAKLLSTGLDRNWLICSVENCEKCFLKQKLLLMLRDQENEWNVIDKNSKAFESDLRIPKDGLIQKLLKGKLYEWLVCKVHEEGKGPNVLDENGQGAIHLAAALGYEWAMSPIVCAGVSPSFRDVIGRTGLHWAAYFGRFFKRIRGSSVLFQAHVRGHQVRKQYKKVVWSVSIVEKAILRWRRKGAGLRGFRAENTTTCIEGKVGATDEYDFLRLGRRQKVASVEKALSRVQSMARHPEGRHQYMRLVACSRKSKVFCNFNFSLAIYCCALCNLGIYLQIIHSVHTSTT